jgi:hypothetical protein
MSVVKIYPVKRTLTQIYQDISVNYWDIDKLFTMCYTLFVGYLRKLERWISDCCNVILFPLSSRLCSQIWTLEEICASKNSLRGQR